MDSLSQLVRLLSPSGSVDLRCRYAGEWQLDHEPAPPGYLPYHLILDGQALLHQGPERHALQPGDVILFPHGAAHRIRSVAGGDDPPSIIAPPTSRRFNGVLTEITRPGAGTALQMLCGTIALGNPGSRLLHTLPDTLCIRTADRADYASLRAVIDMMRLESDTLSPGAGAIVSELSTVLFTVLLRALIADGHISQGVLTLMSDARLARAVNAVLQDPGRDWTIATLAEQSNLSRAAFARQFAELGGLTPMELVTSLRMELAARLLARDNLPGGIAGERCGYASQAAFTRVFKSHFGIAPAAYRRQMQERRLQPRYRSTAALNGNEP